MSLDLSDYENKTREAIKSFWRTRKEARIKQMESGTQDQGTRSEVTAGNNLNGFLGVIADLVKANGLEGAVIQQSRSLVTLPGYFRPAKNWDLLVIYKNELIAAIELKSHIGPSFSNNFNNRAEEAIGTAHDLQTAYREGAFGKQPRPFVGWLMVVEDAAKSRAPAKKEPTTQFPMFPEFKGTSCLERYDLLCQRLAQEQLYTSASVIATPSSAALTGKFSEMSAMTGLKTFVSTFAGHIAAQAARLG